MPSKPRELSNGQLHACQDTARKARQAAKILKQVSGTRILGKTLTQISNETNEARALMLEILLHMRECGIDVKLEDD